MRSQDDDWRVISLKEWIIDFGVDCSSPLYVLVRLSQHVLSATDTGSFLSVTFGSALVQVKRAFDRFFHTQLRSIEESKPSRKSKCEILPFVSNFEVSSLFNAIAKESPIVRKTGK